MAKIARLIPETEIDPGVGTGDYTVKVIDYDGTVLLEKKGNTGDVIDLPTAPTHEKLVFQEWSASVAVSDNKVTIADNDIMVGAVYTTASGQNEFDITLTKVTGLSVTLNMGGTKDWGDGTSSSETSHTYTAYGDYTIKCNGTTMTTSDSVGLFGQSSSSYFCTSARLATIVTVKSYAFYNCYSLKTLTLSKSIKTLQGYSLYYCNLVALIIPTSVSTIPNYFAQNCYNLESIVIPYTVSYWGEYVFQTSYSLKNIVLPSHSAVISTGTHTVSNSALEKIILSNNINRIGDYTFQGCRYLKSIIIRSSLSYIGNNAFRGCYGLTSITARVSKIYPYAFYDCYSIIKYDFSQCTSVPTLDNTNAFSGRNGICKIIVPDSLYDSWIAAANWSTYADYIYKASEVTA